MPGPDGIILGFDPGGGGNFGWSICLTDDGQLEKPLKTGLAHDALSARNAAKNFVDENPAAKGLQVPAAGIDAPMYWGRSGNRVKDDILREELRKIGLKVRVLAVNSLWGAVLVQGVLLGKYLRQEWKDLPITECHPNALRPLLKHSEQHKVVEMMDKLTEGTKDHELDATLAAISAWAMVHLPHGWRDLYELEPQPVQPFGTPVAYWMPKLQSATPG